MTLDHHGWLSKKLEGSLKEYARGIHQKASLEWAIGEVKFAMNSWLSVDEVKGMLLIIESTTSEAERRQRLAQLRERLQL